jgi:CheY-like chemotaxis protein
MVQSVSSCGKSLLALINNILDFSKIEASKLTLVVAPYDLIEAIDATLAIVSANASKENVIIVKDMDRGSPLWIEGDRDRVIQVLLNLLSNAIKFSKNGRVVVRLRVERTDPTRFQINLSVIDNGIGIKEEHLQNLFKEFSQAHPTFQSEFGGTGLGLAIARKLAELIGGKITVKSQYGVGSTFALCFQATEARRPASETMEADSQRLLSADFPHNILVVDDNFINRKVAEDLLSTLGYRPAVAKDGNEALALLNQGEFDVLFTDLRMPHMDGYELVRRAKLSIQKPLLFVAMTASATVEEKERCVLQGITHFISKPIREKDLIDVLSGASTQSL